MRFSDKIILPDPRKEKVTISLSKDELRKRLYSLIDLRFNQLDNKKMLKKFNPNNKKYFGTVGEDFFIAQTKSTVGMNDYYFSIITEGMIKEINELVDIGFEIELTEEGKGKVRFFTFAPIIVIGILFYRIVDQNFVEGWLYILILSIVIIFVRILASYALKRAGDVFLRKFNEVMK